MKLILYLVSLFTRHIPFGYEVPGKGFFYGKPSGK